jgi:hypothetical protein
MIDKDKLTKADREALEKRAAAVRGYFDEAHLLADDLRLTADNVFIVAVMLAIIDHKL